MMFFVSNKRLVKIISDILEIVYHEKIKRIEVLEYHDKTNQQNWDDIREQLKYLESDTFLRLIIDRINRVQLKRK